MLKEDCWIVSKNIFRKLQSADCTILLTELIEASERAFQKEVHLKEFLSTFNDYDIDLQYESQGQHILSAGDFFDKDEFFPLTSKDITESIGMPYHTQSKYLKKLQSLGLIEKKIKGIPGKNHFRVNLYNIAILEEGADS